MSLEQKFEAIARDLSKYKRDRLVVMQEAIISRLNKSLHSYEHDLNISNEYLKHRDNLKLIDKINRS